MWVEEKTPSCLLKQSLERSDVRFQSYEAGKSNRGKCRSIAASADLNEGLPHHSGHAVT